MSTSLTVQLGLQFDRIEFFWTRNYVVFEWYVVKRQGQTGDQQYSSNAVVIHPLQ